MPIITLPDGTQKSFAHPVTVAEVAAAIGAGLAKAALAGKVNQQLVDTSHLIEQDAQVQIITEKSPEALEIIRHSTAHLLAQAVKQLFPSAQVTIGPVIEDGFYYDFAFPQAFTPEDLQRIEAKMHELAAQSLTVTRRVIGRKEAIDFFRQLGEEYKAKIIEDIPEQETLTVYQQGDFVDLCRGPHVPNTDKLKVFKLMKVAGAYWRGDARNEMLQRIYGTAWTTRQELETYLHRLEEAEKRDHRKIAKALDLFHMQEEAPGMVFWHDNGLIIYQTIEQYIRNLLRQQGYQEIKTPMILDLSLWEKSGHKDKFFKEMFTTESENRQFAIKPMNCPCHVQVFKQGLRSYRELPLRLAEFGSCHRNEPSGALHGLFRVRQFVQDDAHIFCTEDQIQEEVSRFIDLLFQVYKDFGFDDIVVKLSTRPPQRVGSDEIWDKAEKALADALNAKKLDWQEQPGDGAFYGPKIEFILRDCLGRLWTTGSVQLDFSMPERLGAEYVAENGSRKVPVMLHRAICGSLERFIGILLEHYAGQLPLWLAPTQVIIMNITDRQADYATQIAQTLKNLGFRVKLDLRNEKIGFKIREHTLQKVPYQLVVGEREVEQQTVAVRTLAGEDKGSMPLAVFTDLLKAEITHRSRNGGHTH
ncbi:MAG: threonine--tRNA ligase [Gammaproteobacteria bacterium]